MREHTMFRLSTSISLSMFNQSYYFTPSDEAMRIISEIENRNRNNSSRELTISLTNRLSSHDCRYVFLYIANHCSTIKTLNFTCSEPASLIINDCLQIY